MSVAERLGVPAGIPHPEVSGSFLKTSFLAQKAEEVGACIY